jgi:hypothetical protein
MCRNIKTLYHFEPPASEEEVRASALQYVRKLSGLKSFSKANKQACEQPGQVTRLAAPAARPRPDRQDPSL